MLPIPSGATCQPNQTEAGNIPETEAQAGVNVAAPVAPSGGRSKREDIKTMITREADIMFGVWTG